MADYVMQFEAVMQDLLSKNTAKISSELNTMTEAMKKNKSEGKSLETQVFSLAKKFLGLAAIKKTVDFLTSATKAAAEQQNSIVSLTTNLGYYSDGLVNLSESLQTTTKFGDDQTESAIALLSTFTKNEKQLMSLVPLIQDYATVYKKDLNTAAIDVGKAISGNTSGMTKLGFSVDTTKNSTERYNSILKQLQDKTKGASEQAAKFGDGPVTRLANQFGEVSETIGSQLLPYVNEFAETLINNMPLIQRVAEFIGKTFVSVFGGVGTIINMTVAGIFTALEKVTKLVGAKELSNTFKIAAEDSAKSAYNSFKIIVEPWDASLNKAKKMNEELKKMKTFSRGTPGDDEGSEKDRAKAILDIRTRLAEDLAKLETSKATSSSGGNAYAELAAKYREETALAKIKFDNEYALLKDNIQAKKLLQQDYDTQRLISQYNFSMQRQQLEQEDYDKSRELHAKFTQNYIDKEKEKEDKIKQAQSSTAAFFTSNLQAMSGETKLFFNLYKTAAISQATVDTYTAATGAYKAMAGIPIVGPGLGIAASAAAIFAGLANIQKIQQTRFAYGGIVPGNQFTGDKQLAFANSGEVFLNTAQQANLLMKVANNQVPVTNNNSRTGNVTLNLYGGQSSSIVDELKRVLPDVIDSALVDADRGNKLQRFRGRVGM